MAIQKHERIANRTITDRDMIDKRIRTMTDVNVMLAIFYDGDQTVRFETQMFQKRVKQIRLFRNSLFRNSNAIQKLKRYSETQTNCKSDYN